MGAEEQSGRTLVFSLPGSRDRGRVGAIHRLNDMSSIKFVITLMSTLYNTDKVNKSVLTAILLNH